MNWLHDLLLDMIRAYRGYIGSTLSEAPDRWREYRRASVAVMLRVRGMRKHYVARAQAAEERARRAEQRETEARGCLDVVYAALSGEPVSDVMHRSPAVRAAAEARVNAVRMGKALRAIATHHVGMNDAAGRPRINSFTLRVIHAAQAGCDHIPGDVCRRCHPSLPMCARHPEAPVRRCGPLWRCGVCGEEATLLASPRPPPAATETRDEIRPLSFDVSAEWVRRPVPTLAPGPTDPEEILP